MDELIFATKRANKLLLIQRQNDAVGLLLDGKTQPEIIGYLTSKYHLTLMKAGRILGEAREVIKTRLKLEVNQLITLHLHRYEELYAELKELGAEIAAMEVLKAKELLLGFHRTGFHMRVKAGQVQQVFQTEVHAEYDLSKLDNVARMRFEELLTKAKRPKPASQGAETPEVTAEQQEFREGRMRKKFYRQLGRSQHDESS